MTMVNAFVPGRTENLAQNSRALLARRDRALGPAYRLFYEKPLHIVRGEGVWLYDHEGRRYLDAYNNVASLGHGRPEVLEAISRQGAVLNTHTRYLNEGVVAYAEALLGRFPPALEHAMFTCTGSEANDLALRIAKVATGGTGVIVTRNAYHGVTETTAGASPSLGPDQPLGPHVWTAPEPPAAGEVGAGFAEGVGRALEAMREAGVRPAALLLDTAFSSDGVRTDPPGFLTEAVERVRAVGGLFIADEVQAGFGRLGEGLWGFARHDLIPDLVTLGKPMGNGHPIAGLVGRDEPLRRFGERIRYFNTFGGNPVSAAAGLAVLEVIDREQLVDNAARIGAYLKARIEGLPGGRGRIGAVRGTGLFLGVELTARSRAPAGRQAASVVNHMRENGVLISATGPNGDVLKIRPPLVFTREHADMLADALDRALGALAE